MSLTASEVLSRAHDRLQPVANYFPLTCVDRYGQWAPYTHAIRWSAEGAVEYECHIGQVSNDVRWAALEAFRLAAAWEGLNPGTDLRPVAWTHGEALAVLGLAYRLALADERGEPFHVH